MDRLRSIHETLADALRRRPQAFDAPVTVAEIYQDLVPYRAVRSALGFDMNADYEHTLLRLLAGEEDLARLGGFLAGTSSARAASQERVSQRLWHRLPWLLIGLLGAMASATMRLMPRRRSARS